MLIQVGILAKSLGRKDYGISESDSVVEATDSKVGGAKQRPWICLFEGPVVKLSL
jgi:hypothetical protein